MGKKIQRIGRYSLDGVTLGWGNFAKVDLATHEITRVKVAIKIIDTKKVKDEYVRSNLHREARIMARLKHPHIVRLYETLKATTLYCLVTEYITGGDLLDHIKSSDSQRLDENSSRLFVRQLLSAIAYLHERGIVHRDLKMENILLDEKKRNIKIIDFGLSNVCKKYSMMRTHCGSPEYAAPELFIIGKTYGPEIDIWSIGVITYAMNLGKLPFSSTSSDEYQKQKMLQQIQKGLSHIHEKEMQVLSANCRNLLHQLIEPQPQLRIPLSEMEKHPWVTKNGKHPFFRFVAFPKSVVLRNQVIGELSYLSEIKKGILNEVVKENKSDEISAMFNMMLDKKKRDLGYFDIDHTRRCQSKSTEKTSTPESCRTTSTLSRKVRTKKNSKESKSEYLPRRATEFKRQISSRYDDTDPASDNTIDDVKTISYNTPNENCNLIFLSQPYFQPRVVNPAPPLKLSMTLDLSVANLCSTTDHIYQPQTNYDCLYGVAASSGVPPRMSPKEESKPLPHKPKRSTFCSISFRKKLVFPCALGSKETMPDNGNKLDKNNVSAICHGRNSCRPTTLFLKMKNKKSCLFSKPKDVCAKKANLDRVVAPRASPESSFIDASSGSFSTNEEQEEEEKEEDKKCQCNWVVAGSTPTKDGKKEEIQSRGVQLNKRINFFTERISTSLDCLLPAFKKTIHGPNNSGNKVFASKCRGDGADQIFANHEKEITNATQKLRKAERVIHDVSLGSCSSPSFPLDELLGIESGRSYAAANDDVT